MCNMGGGKLLGQLNIDGKDKIEVALDRLRMFEPPEGYYLAFSGGKDSICIYYLAKMAGVKFDAHYSHTTVDPPELVRFVRSFQDVETTYPGHPMWQLIVKKRMPPTRIARYCCDVLKEGGGKGRFVITGVRWAESVKRKNGRKIVEFDAYGSNSKKAKEQREIFFNSDNDHRRKMIENCQVKGKHVLNPIVDWLDQDVWSFIKNNNLPYCELYDMGYARLGCIGCPMSGKKGMLKDFKRYPKYKQNYIKAFQRMIDARKSDGLETQWENGEEVFSWWIGS